MSIDTKAIRRALSEATTGPWEHDCGEIFAPSFCVVTDRGAQDENLDLICLLRNSAAEMCDEIARLRKVAEAAREFYEAEKDIAWTSAEQSDEDVGRFHDASANLDAALREAGL